MSTLVQIGTSGIYIVDPPPVADGGAALNGNFTAIAAQLGGKLGLAGGTMTGAVDFNGQELVNANVHNCGITYCGGWFDHWQYPTLALIEGLTLNNYFYSPAAADFGARAITSVRTIGVMYDATAGGAVQSGRTKVDSAQVWDTRSLQALAGRLSTSGTSTALYTFVFEGSTHGWIEATVTAFNSTDDQTIYLRSRWLVKWDGAAITILAAESGSTVDPDGWGASLSAAFASGPDGVVVSLDQPANDNAEVSYKVETKFDFPGSLITY